MVATAAYVTLSRISGDGGHLPSPETQTFSNINATSSAFGLSGGRYGISCHASTYGTVTLQVQAADGATWLTAATAFAADGYAAADLIPGTYRVALA